MPVLFIEHTARIRIPHKWAIRAALTDIASGNGYRLGNLNYILASNATIRRINRQFLAHNYSTDIITFPTYRGISVDADIFLGVEVIFANANRYHCPLYHELLRVIFHGLLHCVGYDDHSPAEVEAMRAQEQRYIAECLARIEAKGRR